MPGGIRVGQNFKRDVLTLGLNFKSDDFTLGHDILGDVPPSSRGGMVPDIIERDTRALNNYLQKILCKFGEEKPVLKLIWRTNGSSELSTTEEDYLRTKKNEKRKHLKLLRFFFQSN